MAELIWWVPGLPLIGFLINSLLMSGRPVAVRKRTAGPIAALASGAAFVVALIIATQMGSILGAERQPLRLDRHRGVAAAGAAGAAD
jgi:hypothetical protein